MTISPLPLLSRSLSIAVATILCLGAVPAAEVTKITALDGGANDQFGISVSVSSTAAVVGAWRDDAANLSSGSAYIFQKAPGGQTWMQLKKLIPLDGAAGDLFGGSVWIDGDLLIAGATGDDDFGSESGSAYIFERTLGGATNWGQRIKLVAGDAALGHAFGSSVTLSGEIAVVGAPGGPGAGAAYVFRRDLGGANAWGELKKLIPSSSSAGANFGSAVSLSGDTLAVGASRDGDSVAAGGAVYIFQRHQGGINQWGEVRKLTPSNSVAGQTFGAALALSDNTLVVGAPDEISLASGSGYVFERNSGGSNNWDEVKKLTADAAGSGALFGSSVAIEGDSVVVGAPGSSGSGVHAGSAYVFLRHRGGGDNWGQVQTLDATDTSAESRFGSAVAVTGDRALIGADGDRHAGNDSGSVYVFQPVTQGPNISIAKAENQILLSWPATVPDSFVLEKTASLAPANWSKASTGTTNPVLVTIEGNSGFFRLVQRPVLPVAFVPIGHPGNPADTTGFGGVGDTFQIGKFEVTNDDYSRFLNAVAATDSFNLYNPAMTTDPRGGIVRSGAAGSYFYTVKANMGNKPVNYVSFYDALRFANWLHNGQPVGPQNASSTEAGAYVFTDPNAAGARSPTARIWLPSETEWYKAAYYDPEKGSTGGYWTYPTRSNATPTPATADVVGNTSNAGSNVANYGMAAVWNSQDGNVTTVGSSGPTSASFFGAADMGGNVAEWTESLLDGTAVVRGGAWGDFESNLESSSGITQAPLVENDSVGFRIARP